MHASNVDNLIAQLLDASQTSAPQSAREHSIAARATHCDPGSRGTLKQNNTHCEGRNATMRARRTSPRRTPRPMMTQRLEAHGAGATPAATEALVRPRRRRRAAVAVVAKAWVRGAWVWLAYVLPLRPLWDAVHAGGATRHWREHAATQAVLVAEINQRHPAYASLLDLGCSRRAVASSRGKKGCFFAARQKAQARALRRRHQSKDGPPRATNLSPVSRRRSSTPRNSPCRRWPDSLDVVLVSDVLYYIPFAGVPQMVASENRNVAASRPWFAAVSRLARREVVFSSHQNNPWVRAMLRAAGARQLSPGGAWALAGTAPAVDESATRGVSDPTISTRAPSAPCLRPLTLIEPTSTLKWRKLTPIAFASGGARPDSGVAPRA